MNFHWIFRDFDGFEKPSLNNNGFNGTHRTHANGTHKLHVASFVSKGIFSEKQDLKIVHKHSHSSVKLPEQIDSISKFEKSVRSVPNQYVTPSCAPDQVIMHSKCPLDREFLAHISNQSIFFKTSQRSFLFPFWNHQVLYWSCWFLIILISEPKPQQPNVHLLHSLQSLQGEMKDMVLMLWLSTKSKVEKVEEGLFLPLWSCYTVMWLNLVFFKTRLHFGHSAEF